MNILKKNRKMRLENAYEALFLERDLKRHPLYDGFLLEWSRIWFSTMKKMLKITNIYDLNDFQIQFLIKNSNLHPKLFLEEILSMNSKYSWLLSYNPNMTMEFWDELKTDKFKKYHHIFDFKHDIYIFQQQQKRCEWKNQKIYGKYEDICDLDYIKRLSEYGCVTMELVKTSSPDTFDTFGLACNPSITFEEMEKYPEYSWHTTECFDPDFEVEDCKFNALILNPNMTFDLLQKIIDNKFSINSIQIPFNKYNRYRIWENQFTWIRVEYILQKIILCYEERKKMLKELIIEAWRPERFEKWCL